MRILVFPLILVLVSVSFSAQSYAGSKSWGGWSKSWQELDFQPYLGEQKTSQRSLVDDDAWTPEDWAKDDRDKKRVMRNLYAGDIITKQYKDRKNIPVLEVGDSFIALSSIDRSRILQFVDHVFEITSSEENGMFYVFYDDKNAKILDDNEPLGLYNKHGFQSY